jgi:hypothetical protein
MKGGDVNNEQERRNGGTLRSAYPYGGKIHRGALKEQPARPDGEKRANPGNKIFGDPFEGEGPGQGPRVDVIKTPFDVEKQRGGEELGFVGGPNLMVKGRHRIE